MLFEMDVWHWDNLWTSRGGSLVNLCPRAVCWVLNLCPRAILKATWGILKELNSNQLGGNYTECILSTDNICKHLLDKHGLYTFPWFFLVHSCYLIFLLVCWRWEKEYHDVPHCTAGGQWKQLNGYSTQPTAGPGHILSYGSGEDDRYAVLLTIFECSRLTYRGELTNFPMDDRYTLCQEIHENRSHDRLGRPINHLYFRVMIFTWTKGKYWHTTRDSSRLRI